METGTQLGTQMPIMQRSASRMGSPQPGWTFQTLTAALCWPPLPMGQDGLVSCGLLHEFLAGFRFDQHLPGTQM